MEPRYLTFCLLAGSWLVLVLSPFFFSRGSVDQDKLASASISHSPIDEVASFQCIRKRCIGATAASTCAWRCGCTWNKDLFMCLDPSEPVPVEAVVVEEGQTIPASANCAKGFTCDTVNDAACLERCGCYWRVEKQTCGGKGEELPYDPRAPVPFDTPYLFELSKVLPAETPLSIAFVGDSITHMDKYLKVLRAHTRATSVTPLRFLNFGIDGARIDHLLNGSDPIHGNNQPPFREIARTYDVIALQVGTNDVILGKTAKAFARQLEDALIDVLDAGVKIYLVTVGVIGEKVHVDNPLGSRNGQIREHADAVVALGKRHNVFVADAFGVLTELEDIHNPTALSTGVFTADGIHPNHNGAVVYANLHAQGILHTLRASRG